MATMTRHAQVRFDDFMNETIATSEDEIVKSVFSGLQDFQGNPPQNKRASFDEEQFVLVIDRCIDEGILISGIETWSLEGDEEYDCYVMEIEREPGDRHQNHWCYRAIEKAKESKLYSGRTILFYATYFED